VKLRIIGLQIADCRLQIGYRFKSAICNLQSAIGKSSGVWLLLFIVGYGLFLRCLGLFDVWSDDTTGYNGGYNSIIARNYLRDGYWHRKFAQVWEGGPIGPSSYIYTNHPPLVPLLVSLSFKLFRTTNEWSARLVPLIFSVASLFVLYFLAKKIWTERVALLAVFIAAVVPMATSYATNVCYEAISIFSFLLVLYFYMQYLAHPGAGSLTFMLLSLLLGALNDWPIFFAVPLLTAHYFFLAKGRKWSFLVFPAVAGLVFLLVVTQVIAGGSLYHVYEVVHSYLLEPDAPVSQEGAPVTPANWISTVLYYHVELYTLPILILFAAWLPGLARRAVRRENLAQDGPIIILILFGLINIGVGWQRVVDRGHAYWASLAMPGLVLAAAVVLDYAYGRWVAASRKPVYSRGLFYLLLLALAVSGTKQLYSLYSPGDYDYKYGMAIARNSEFRDVILAPEEFDSPVTQFYADRNMHVGISDLNDFSSIYYDNVGADRRQLFFMKKPQDILYPELYRFLDLAFDKKTDQDFLIFDLQRKRITDAAIVQYIAVSTARYNFWSVMKHAADSPDAVSGNFHYDLFSINGDARRVLVTDPKVTFHRVPITGSPSLKIGVALEPFWWQVLDNGVQFQVAVRSGDQDHVLFSKRIDPANNPDDRTWHDELIDLSPFHDREIDIIMAVEGAPGTSTDGAGWSDLEIIYN
jgi:4-amino-4-deoxy-L-arabinose transferase-like glycosyltransferase